MTSYGSMPVVPGQMVMPMQPTVNPAFQPYYNSYQSSRYFKPRVNPYSSVNVPRYNYRDPAAVKKAAAAVKRKKAAVAKKEPTGQWGRGNTFLGGLGQTAGNAVSHFFGLGSYSIKKNSLLQDPLPVVNNKTKSGQTVIRHREYIKDIISGEPGTFNIESFPINPAQEKTFPWLSQVAANYEQYRIDGMLFEFRTMSADALNSVNTALGQVIMATDYNAANPPFGQKSEMENYEFGQSCKPSESQIHPIECARNQTTISELYTRANEPREGEDIRLYDLGNFQIATNGFQGQRVNCGELWVTYQVTFFKSKMFASLGNYNWYGNYVARPPQFTPDLTNLFGLGPAENADEPYWRDNNADFELARVEPNTGLPTSGTIIFPNNGIKQTYWVHISWLGDLPGVITPSFSANSTNCTLRAGGSIDPLVGGPIPGAGTTSNRMSYQFAVYTDGSGRIPYVNITASGGALPTASFVYVNISQIPNEAWEK